MTKLPAPLHSLIAYFKKLPGVGTRTAERFVFDLLQWQEKDLDGFGTCVQAVKKADLSCSECYCLREGSYCPYCDSNKRDAKTLCILASAKDMFTIERTHMYRGLYHVLGGLLSPAIDLHSQNLRIDTLIARAQTHAIEEVIIALDSTLEGDATALYVRQQLACLPAIKISRLAYGLPLNSSLDFVDGGTLGKALAGRQRF